MTKKVSPSTVESYDGEKRIMRTAAGTLFAFYYDGSEIRYRVSFDDGSHWDDPSYGSMPATGKVTSESHRWTIVAARAGSDYVYLLYHKLSLGNTLFLAKMGTITNSIFGEYITWQATPEQLHIEANPASCTSCARIVAWAASPDQAGTTIFAAFRWLDASSLTYKYMIKKVSTGSTSWDSTPSLAESDSFSTNKITITLTLLASPKMLFTFMKFEDNILRYRVFSGSTWSSSSQTLSDLSTYVYKQASAASDTLGKAYMVYVTGGNHGTIRMVSFTTSGSYNGAETVDDKLNHRLPSITVRPDNNAINVYSVAKRAATDTYSNVYIMYKVNGYWLPPQKPYGDSASDTNQLTVGWGLGGRYAPVMWTHGTSSFEIRESGIIFLIFVNHPVCTKFPTLDDYCYALTKDQYNNGFKYKTPENIFTTSTGCEVNPARRTFYEVGYPGSWYFNGNGYGFNGGSHTGFALVPGFVPNLAFSKFAAPISIADSFADIGPYYYQDINHGCIPAGYYTEYIDVLSYTKLFGISIIIKTAILENGYP